jgi:hypothetical protein
MPSNFAAVGKDLEDAIPVPELPLSSIRGHARDQNIRHRAQVLVACVVAAIVVFGSGSVLAAMKYGGVRLWLSGDKATLLIHSFTVINNPTADDLRRVTADATFPVVLPAGIPKGMHLTMLVISPADHPSFIDVQYRNDKTPDSAWEFPLFDSSSVNAGEIPPMPTGEKLRTGPVTQWTVGRETIATNNIGVLSRLSEVKDAMSRLTPAQSLAQTLPMLRRIAILGGLDSVAATAEAIAPADGRSVLVDRGNLVQIAALARERKPLLSTRSITVDNLPMAAGKADFAHATSHLNKEVVLSADGVRALAAVLAMETCGSKGGAFTCELLVNERSGRPYLVWVLPINASTPPAKYIVDGATFHVSPGG